MSPAVSKLEPHREMKVKSRVFHPDLPGYGEVQGAHRGVVVHADPRTLVQADLREGVKGVAGVVKCRYAPIREKGPIEFNAAGQEMLSPHHLTGCIGRAEGLVGKTPHALIPAGKETE